MFSYTSLISSHVSIVKNQQKWYVQINFPELQYPVHVIYHFNRAVFFFLIGWWNLPEICVQRNGRLMADDPDSWSIPAEGTKDSDVEKCDSCEDGDSATGCWSSWVCVRWFFALEMGNPPDMWNQYLYVSGWWFGTFFTFPYIGNVIIPTDFHIFQRGRSTTNQVYIYIFKFIYHLVI